MAVVGTAGRGIVIYQLDGQPREYKKVESPLKYQHRCVSVFKDKKGAPTGLHCRNDYIAVQCSAVQCSSVHRYEVHCSEGWIQDLPWGVLRAEWPSSM